MGELVLIHGPAHPGKCDPLLQRALERVDADRGDSFIHLVPSRWQARQLRQRLLADTTAGLLLCPHILGLEDFSRALYRLCPERRSPLPVSARRLFVEDALRQLAPSATYLHPERDELFPGLVQAATRLVAELDAAGLATADLESHLDEFSAPDRVRFPEFLPLIRAYHNHLEPRWISSSEMLRATFAHLDADSFHRCFPEIDLLLISGFDTFSPPLRQVLDRLFTILPAACVALDFLPDRPRLFGRAAATFHFLGQRATQVTLSTPTPANAPVALLEPHLFTRTSASLTAPLDLLPCVDRLAEVEEIARHIHLLHRQQDAPLREIRVCFRDPDQYAPLVEEVFPRYGLPFHLTRGQPLLRVPVIAALLAIFDTVLERYTRPALLRLLGLPWVGFTFSFADQEIPLPAADLDAWSRSLQIGPGSAGWLQALDSRIAYLERQIENATHGILTDEIDDPRQWASELQEERESLRQLRAGISSLFSLLTPLERPLAPETLRQRLFHLLRRLGFTEYLAPARADPRQVRRDARAFQAFCDLLDELCLLAPSLHQQRLPLRALTDLLRTGLASAHIIPDPPRGIQVAGLEEASGHPCDHLFVGGLVEGELPRFPAPDIFLEDRVRSALGLEDMDSAIAADRLLFYRAIASARRTLSLLFPQREGNTALSPSSFIEEIEQLLDRPQPARAEEESETVHTRAALHAVIGRGLHQPATSAAALRAADLLRQGLRHSSLSSPLRRLLHGIEITAERTRPDRPGPYEGILQHPRILSAVQSRLGRGHAFSITQLETYGLCPFQFFADRLLNIAPLPDPDAEETALERGNLIHRILYHFFIDRRREGFVEPVTPDNWHAACQQLRAIALREAEVMGLRDFFWEQELERLLGRADGQGREGVLVRFLREEAESVDPALPAHFELSFGSYPGMGPRDPASTTTPFVIPDPEADSEVRLFGKIDRLDRIADGRFVVYDYKTGQVPPVADIDRGLSLQLPLYLLAAETLLQDQGLREGAAGAYYQLRDLEHCGRQGLFANAAHQGQVYVAANRRLPDHETFRQRLDQTRVFVRGYARAMRAGVFHVTRQTPERACGYCHFRQSCRLDHRRMRALEREGKLP